MENLALPEPNTGCWIFTGAIRTHDGYGYYKRQLAHRVFYEHFVGKIPDGLTIDHLCRNRWCVNPQHLEPVTRGENVLRGLSLSAAYRKRSHCNYGHEFSSDNIYWHRQPNGKTYRECATCVKDRRLSRYYSQGD